MDVGWVPCPGSGSCVLTSALALLSLRGAPGPRAPPGPPRAGGGAWGGGPGTGLGSGLLPSWRFWFHVESCPTVPEFFRWCFLNPRSWFHSDGRAQSLPGSLDSHSALGDWSESLFPSPERQWQCVLVGKHGLQGLGLGPPCASDSLSCYRGSLLICTIRIHPVPGALPGAVHL